MKEENKKTGIFNWIESSHVIYSSCNSIYWHSSCIVHMISMIERNRSAAAY